MAIERKFVAQNIREFMIKEYVEKTIDRVGLSDAKLKRTPLGDKIIITAARPGLVVGRGGANIQSLTKALKAEFGLDNPQIEIAEVEKPDLDADVVAERIITTLERFGSGRTKGIGHRTTGCRKDRLRHQPGDGFRQSLWTRSPANGCGQPPYCLPAVPGNAGQGVAGIF